MHEIGIVRQIARTVTEYAERNGVEQIEEIVVDCGELSLVIPRYLEELYPVVTQDTALRDTKLIVEVVPGMAECDDCDEIFNVVEHEGYCPNCGSFEKTILSGRDCTIREIHVKAT